MNCKLAAAAVHGLWKGEAQNLQKQHCENLPVTPFSIGRFGGNRRTASFVLASILGVLFLMAAGVISAQGQQKGGKEWCALVHKGCIKPAPTDDILNLCGLGQCRSPCPGERCGKNFRMAEEEHCKILRELEQMPGSGPGSEKRKDLESQDEELKQQWNKYNGAARCERGGDIDCFYADIGGLTDACGAALAPGRCTQEADQMHAQHCKNVSNWWTAKCKGDNATAQTTFDQDFKLKHNDYPALSQKPECQGITLPPELNPACFPPPSVCGPGNSPSSSSDGGGGPAGGGGGGGGGGGPVVSPPPIPHRPVHGVLIGYILWPGLPVGHKPKPMPIPKGLVTVPVLQLRAWQQLAAARDWARNPVAAPDYSVSVPDETPFDLAAIQQILPPDNADEISRSGFAAVNAVWDEVGWLDSFAVHYDRYLGAKAAGDKQAMLSLANEMAVLIDRALAAGQDAATKQDNFEHQVEAKLDEIHTAVAAAGGSWPSAFKQARDQIKGQGLPQEVQQELKDAGITDQETKAFQQRLTAVTPESIQADIAALKKPDAAASPQPLYLADLQAAQQVAYKARDEARAADEAAKKEAAAKVPSPPGPGAQSQMKSSSRSMILWGAVALLAVVVMVAFFVGLRSARRGRTQ